MNPAFAESTTSTAFNLSLTKKQCNTMLRLFAVQKDTGSLPKCRFTGPASVHILQTADYKSLFLRGMVSWKRDEEGKANGFEGLTAVGLLVCQLLVEAGLTIENTNTISTLRRLEDVA